MEYKGMDWYLLLGFSRNKINNGNLSREEYCSKYLEDAYQKCLSMINRDNLEEINKFYKTQTLNYYKGKIENIEELREKITVAYHVLKDPQKMKEYEFEVYGIFSRDYPENEVADTKFKDMSIEFVKNQKNWDDKLNHVWKKYLSNDYWKKWRTKIETSKYKEEIKFYIRKYEELRMFILKITNWGKEPQFGGKINLTENAKLISQKEIELKNMSKEKWVKKKSNQPPRDGEWREMSAKEVEKNFFGGLSDYGWEFEKKSTAKTFSSTSNQGRIFILMIVVFFFTSLSLFLFFSLRKKVQTK